MTTTLSVTGEKLVASGTCLSRTDDGRIIFVDGLLPGEKAEVVEQSTKSNTSFASIETIENVSDLRVEPPCPYVEHGCGGCDWQHIRINDQPALKRDIVVDALSRIGKMSNAEEMVEQPIVLSAGRYRTTARILATSTEWGFRKAHSNDMVPIEDCMVLHSECVHQASDVMASIESGDNVDDENDGNEEGDDVFEAQVRRSPDVFFDKQLVVSPSSFYQSHIDAPKTLANMVLEFAESLQTQLNCVDLYGGVGIFSVALSSKGHNVLCVESNRQAVEDAEVNLAEETAYVLKCDVNNFDFARQHHLASCDFVVADPSREGLGKNGVRAIVSCDPEHIVLISCDPASGARDLNLLMNEGYSVSEITPIDMFGYTHHVEMVSILFK